MIKFRVLIAYAVVLFLSFFCGALTLFVVWPAERIAEGGHVVLEAIENFVTYLGEWQYRGWKKK